MIAFWVHIDIKMLSRRSSELKEELARKTLDLVVSSLKFDKRTVSASFQDVPLEKWDQAMSSIPPETIIIPDEYQR